MHVTNLLENMKSFNSWYSLLLSSDRLVRGLHRPLVCNAQGYTFFHMIHVTYGLTAEQTSIWESKNTAE